MKNEIIKNIEYPFFYIGQGMGKPAYYELYLDIKFKKEPTHIEKESILKLLPEYLSKDFKWENSLLKLENSDIGHYVKYEFEPNWSNHLSIDEAFDKDLELWNTPKKDSWEKFNQHLDVIVYKIHQYFAIEFAIKYFETPKSKCTKWHIWSSENGLLPILNFVESSSKDYSGLLYKAIKEYYKTVSNKEINEDLIKQIVDFVVLERNEFSDFILGELLSNCTIHNQNVIIKKAKTSMPVPLFLALCKPSKKIENLLDNDTVVKELSTIAQELIKSNKQDVIYKIFDSAYKIIVVNYGINDSNYISALGKKNIKQAARIFEILILGFKAENVEPEMSKFYFLYVLSSSIFSLLGDDVKAKQYAQFGFEIFCSDVKNTDSLTYLKYCLDYAKAFNSQTLIELYQK